VDLYAAVDLGASNVRVALGDERGFRKKLSEETELEKDAAGIAVQIIRMIRALISNDIAAVGVGSLGPLDISAGIVANPPNMPFKRIPLIEPLQLELQKPVRLLNDCSAAVLGDTLR
jgi:glucokinase